MKTRGGARPGAGRKPAPYPRDIAVLLSRAVTADDWHNLIRALVKRASEGDAHAAQTLLRFRARAGAGPAVATRAASTSTPTVRGPEACLPADPSPRKGEASGEG